MFRLSEAKRVENLFFNHSTLVFSFSTNPLLSNSINSFTNIIFHITIVWEKRIIGYPFIQIPDIVCQSLHLKTLITLKLIFF